MNDVVRRAWAGAVFNGDFFCINTYSGYRSSMRDEQGAQHLLAPDASEDALGVALLDALARSRFVLPDSAKESDHWIHPEAEFDGELYDWKRGVERQTAWAQRLMTHYGYKSNKALFKNMAFCNIESQERELSITPMRHVKQQAWEGLGPNDEGTVIVSADASSVQIGEALKLAFSRCVV